jgi:hypothetical protein
MEHVVDAVSATPSRRAAGDGADPALPAADAPHLDLACP